MSSFFSFMGWATVAALIMAPVHTLFGIHIVRRGLIFIDLAVAQVAALGMALAIALGNEAASPTAYKYSIGFALLGALAISLSRFRLGRVPHEAIIGIVYVLSTAASMIVLEFDPSGHGSEEMRDLLTGNILFVQKPEIEGLAWTFGVIAALILVLWRPITALTEQKHENLTLKGVALDFVFYALLGFMVATSVKVAGVLVVFSWLVMPAVVAFFFAARMLPASIVAILTGLLATLGGLVVSFYAPDLPFGQASASGHGNWPTGPTIVVALGAIVVLAYLVRLFLPTGQTESDSVSGASEAA